MENTWELFALLDKSNEKTDAYNPIAYESPWNAPRTGNDSCSQNENVQDVLLQIEHATIVMDVAKRRIGSSSNLQKMEQAREEENAGLEEMGSVISRAVGKMHISEKTVKKIKRPSLLAIIFSVASLGVFVFCAFALLLGLGL